MDITLGLTSVSSSLTANLKVLSPAPISGFDVISGGPINASNTINLPTLNKTPTAVSSTGSVNSTSVSNERLLTPISSIASAAILLSSQGFNAYGNQINSSIGQLDKTQVFNITGLNSPITLGSAIAGSTFAANSVSSTTSVNTGQITYSNTLPSISISCIAGILYPTITTSTSSVSSSNAIGQVGILREFFAGISGTSISSSVNNISKSYSVGLNPTQTNISNAIIHSDIMISTHGVSDSSSVNSIGADYSIVPTGNTIKAFETPIAFIRAKSDERYIAFIRPRTTIDKYRK